MPDVPRRLRPGHEQRLKTSLDTHAARSASGSSSAARPVPATSNAQIYNPPVSLNVVTGTQVDDTGTSITSTIAGGGSSNVTGADGVAIGDSSTAADMAVAVGLLARALFSDDTAVGHNADAQGGDSTAIGANAYAPAAHAVAISGVASAQRSIAIGGTASHQGGVAVGVDSTGNPATSNADNEIAVGTANHITVIRGKLVIADSSGGLHQIVVSTGGVLSTVAYP